MIHQPTLGETNDVKPAFQAQGFTCPHCRIYARQNWWQAAAFQNSGTEKVYRNKDGTIPQLAVNYCEKCNNFIVWFSGKPLHPPSSAAPMPFHDMPADVKTDFMEARTVFDLSPRSAAALLRLAIQKLMPHLGEKGENINADIKSLVAKGLPERLQKALDVVRIVGNNAVHPGQIDLQDNRETALALFVMVNLVVEQMVTLPKFITSVYETLPAPSLEAIEKRDGKVPVTP